MSFGIETAADVSQPAILRIPGFGHVTTRKLVDWRKALESRFRYNPAQSAQDIAVDRALRAQFASQKANLEAAIRKGAHTLRTARARIETLPRIAQTDQPLLQALEERDQAEKDLKLIGATVPKSTVTL